MPSTAPCSEHACGLRRLPGSRTPPAARACSWGGISNINFGRNEAVVACRTLLFPDPSLAEVSVTRNIDIPQRMWIQQLSCTGQESSLGECSISWCNETCPYPAFTGNLYTHAAAVRCSEGGG